MRKIILTCAALLLSVSVAQAQNNSNATAGNFNSSETQAGASLNFAPNSSTTVDNPDSIDTTPPVYAPNTDAGTNPCAIGASGGASVTGFGLAFGSSWTDEDCADRNWFALLTSRNMEDVAIAYACLNNPKAERALTAAGYDCPEDPRVQQANASDSNGVQQASASNGGVPSFCDDGGLATAKTIRRECPNSETILANRGWW